MDNLARSQGDSAFISSFADILAAQGSLPVIAPLEQFLKECREPTALRRPGQVARAALLADIAHFMSVSHGRHPGVVDHAATKIIEDEARGWLVQTIDAFAAERSYLSKLTVSAGPMNSHSGQEKVSGLLASQAKSFELLATSDRAGCAAGAAIAFTLDWQTTRPLFDSVALLLDVKPGICTLPPSTDSLAVVAALRKSPLVERAMLFGAQQLLAQQRGLWKIIAARHAEMREL